jgi:peptide/nickel transport system substrate-binding protein
MKGRDPEMLDGRIERRTFLTTAALGVGGLATAALVGCGTDEDTPGAELTSTAEAPAGFGRLIQDPALPYPYQFPDPAGQPKTGGIAKLSTTYELSIFDPVKSPAGGTIQVGNMVYNRLLGFVNGPEADPLKLELKPELAQSWERTPDGLRYTFKIAPNVKWQNLDPLNGRTFEASDVKFAYDRYKASGQGTAYFENVSTIDVPDPLTVRITVKKPTADFLFNFAGRYLPIFPHELVDDSTIERRAIGTGPMILKDSAQGVGASYVKNPNYWRRPVLLDGAEQKIIPDASARLAAFRTGQVDYGHLIVTSPSEAKNVLSTNPDAKLQVSPIVTGVPLALNLQLPKYQDERVRQAISMSMDRASITKILDEGLGKAPPALPWNEIFDKEPTMAELGPNMQFNIADAKKLLDAAGATNLEINSVYFAYTARIPRMSEILTDMFRTAGITFKDKAIDYTEFVSQWTTGKIVDATSYGWQTVGYDADNYFYTQVHSKSPGNRNKINDPQFDAWAEAQQIELNPASRKEIFKKMWDYELKKMYRIAEPSNLSFATFQPWLRGLRGGSAASNPAYDGGAMIESVWLDK